MEECMLLVGNVQIHGTYNSMTAELFVLVHICVFKTVRLLMTLGAVLEPTIYIPPDQQLRQMDSETLVGLD